MPNSINPKKFISHDNYIKPQALRQKNTPINEIDKKIKIDENKKKDLENHDFVLIGTQEVDQLTNELDAVKEINFAIQIENNRINQKEIDDKIGSNKELKNYIPTNFNKEEIDPKFSEPLQFLESIFPREVQKHWKIFKLKDFKAFSILIQQYLYAVDTDQPDLALICKGRILESAEKLHKKAYAYLKIKNSLIIKYPNLKNDLNFWKRNLELQQRELSVEYIKTGISTISGVISTLKMPLDYLPVKYFPSEAFVSTGKEVLVGTSWFINFVGLIFSTVDLHQKNKNVNIFHNWLMEYKTWKSDITTKIPGYSIKEVPDENEKEFNTKWDTSYGTHSGVQSINDLIDKRKRNTEKKINLIKQDPIRFKAVKEEVRDMKQASYNLSMVKMNQALNDSNGENFYATIENELSQWNLSKESNHPAIEDIMISFNATTTAQKNLLDMLSESNNLDSNQINQLHAQFSINHDLLITKLQAFLSNSDIKQKAFDHWMTNMETTSEDQLLTYYIDHQKVLEKTAVGALHEMVEQKHALEKEFVKAKFNEAAVCYSASAISLTITVSLGILTILSMPLPGAWIILLALTTGTTIATYGFMGMSYHLALTKKPSSLLCWFTALPYKSMHASLRFSYRKFRTRLKETKLIAVSQMLNDLSKPIDNHPNRPFNQKVNRHNEKYLQTFNKYNQIRRELRESQSRLQHWEKISQDYQEQEDTIRFDEFAKFAHLGDNKGKIDRSLESFIDAYSQCDLTMLSKNSKKLFQMQLDWSIEENTAKNPLLFKKHLLKFFGMSDVEFITFAKRKLALKAEGYVKH
ncbi:MAG: hypothetical protein Q8K60_09500 [Parachlamydiaceae bacterium]|nr:hypothetical protein [Parachlamydiaceae bacterium]